MPRGLFTQSTTILFSEMPSAAAVEGALARWSPRNHPTEEPSWFARSDELSFVFDPDHNGRLVVDRCDEPWPDSMGDPQTDAMLFGAWTMGAFGPQAYPGGLSRAVRQAFAFREAGDVVPCHRAFVRIRTSYCLGADSDAPVWPDGADAMGEIAVMLDVARALLAVPGSLALFDPNAEIVLPAHEVDASLAHAERAAVPPLDLVTHVRLFNIEGSDFGLMDTVGMDRFFLPDAELALSPATDPNEGARFLRNLSLHHLRRGSPIPDGHTTDGPGGRYRLHHRDSSLFAPPRATVRVVPDFAAAPAAFLDR